jgi:diaminopimelate decarboxylase/aspartate kinase
VLLGRGGSDTAAAYFAAKLNAHRLDIWTDVPGMFTTNPHNIPAARLLKSLSYDEAETLAGMGAKVLHPHCIRPVREAGIPLHIRWIADPDVPGTLIEAPLTDHANGVKAVSARNSLCLISMDKNAGWQPVGFLADVCAPFKKHAVSIDQLASSSSNIRATIDLSAQAILKEKIDPLVRDLRKVCHPTVHENAASVCLVGHGIRAIIHELAATLTLLKEQNLFMLTQAANDLTFSFVVPEDKSDALLRTLHETLFEQSLDDEHFGPSWAQLNSGSARAVQ